MIIDSKKIGLIITILSIVSFIIFPSLPVYAQGPPSDASTIIKKGVVDTGLAAGLGNTETDLRAVAARIIYYLLGFLGILFTILIIYGGFIWMTAGGNEEKVASSKKILTNSAIGLLIIIVAYGLTKFVFDVIIISIQDWY